VGAAATFELIARFTPLFAIGAASLVWQVASARSLLEGLRGNELGLGLVLTCWLLLTGLGSLAGSRLASPARGVRRGEAERRRGAERRWDTRALLGALLLLCPAGLLLSALLQSGAALADPAVAAGPGRTLALALVSLAPSCILLGAAFALAARAPEAGVAAGAWASRVFAVESLGTVAAGVAFHFLLASASLRAAGLFAGAVLWLSGLLLSARARVRALVPALLGAVALLYLTPGVPLPGRERLSRRVPGYELLEHRSSPHAALAVLARGDQLLFFANGQVVFSNQDEQRIENEVHLGLLAHRAPEQVLMVGGALGGGLREALKHGPRRVEVVELDPMLVELARRHLPALAGELLDPRVHLIVGDGRQHVRRAPPASYDVILIGLPGPASALMNRFYTEELFAAARRALRPGGHIQVALEGREGYLSDAAALAHRSVLLAMEAAGLHPTALPGGETLVLGGRDGAVKLEPGELAARLRQRQLRTAFVGPAELADRTQPFARELYAQALAAAPGRAAPNRDLQPAAYFQSSLLWLALGSPGLARRALRAGELCWRHPWLAPLAGLALGLLGALLRRRRPAAGLALFAAGLAGLGLELCAILACQLSRGVVYRELGILTAAFMLGLTVGALGGRRLLVATERLALTVALAGCGASALLTLVLLPLALRWPAAALALLLFDLLVVGTAVGACYPPAAASLAARHGPSASARAYVFDLVGAALGSLLAGGLALPVLGLPGTCGLCAALCLGVAAGLRRGI
jgi:spermidine synthase